MPGVPCERPSHGSVQNAANGMQPESRRASAARLHQQAHLPVSGVQAERDRRPVRRPHAALGAEDHERRLRGLGRLPAHRHVVGEPEQVAARPLRAASRR